MNRFFVAESGITEYIPTLAFSISIENMQELDYFDQFVDREVSVCLDMYADVNPKDINTIVGYHQLHEKYGEKSKKIIPAPEALIKLLKKKGTIPRINPLVDIYNLISVKYALALGAHDLDKVQGDIVLKFALGGEVFIPLGTTATEEIYPNEYGYFDAVTNEVLCRLEARQCDKTKISCESKRILMIIQGNVNTNAQYLLNAKNEFIHNLKLFSCFSINEEFNYIGES